MIDYALYDWILFQQLVCFLVCFHTDLTYETELARYIAEFVFTPFLYLELRCYKASNRRVESLDFATLCITTVSIWSRQTNWLTMSSPGKIGSSQKFWRPRQKKFRCGVTHNTAHVPFFQERKGKESLMIINPCILFLFFESPVSPKRGFVRKWEDFEFFWFGAALRNR